MRGCTGPCSRCGKEISVQRRMLCLLPMCMAFFLLQQRLAAKNTNHFLHQLPHDPSLNPIFSSYQSTQSPPRAPSLQLLSHAQASKPGPWQGKLTKRQCIPRLWLTPGGPGTQCLQISARIRAKAIVKIQGAAQKAFELGCSATSSKAALKFMANSQRSMIWLRQIAQLSTTMSHAHNATCRTRQVRPRPATLAKDVTMCKHHAPVRA